MTGDAVSAAVSAVSASTAATMMGHIMAPLRENALALVPPGLTAVATFPPFASPRTVPAIAAIFEDTGVDLNFESKSYLHLILAKIYIMYIT